MSEKSFNSRELHNEANEVPKTAQEFVSTMRDKRQALIDQMTEAESRDTSHGLVDVSETYERQRRRDLHELQGKLFEMDEVWQDCGGSEIDRLEAEFRDPANKDKAAIRDHINRAKEAAYQNYLDEMGISPEEVATDTTVANESPAEKSGEPAPVDTNEPAPAGASEPSSADTGETPFVDDSERAKKKRTMKIGERVVELSGAKIPGTKEAAPAIDLKTPETTTTTPASEGGESPKPAPAGREDAPKDGKFDALSEEARRKIIEATATKINEMVDALDDEADEYTVQRELRFADYKRRLEASTGLSENDVAKLFDLAIDRSDELEDEANDDGEGAVDQAAIDAHTRTQAELGDAGALADPDSRRARRQQRKKLRELRLKKAETEANDWYEQKETFTSTSEVNAKRKEIYSGARDEYFIEKEVKNSLMNRLRYRFGREPK